MLDVGSFGQVMIVIFTIAGLGIATPFYFLYAAHIYITALTFSSGGVDRIVWPRESVFEWFGKGFLVLAVLLVWSALTLPLVALVLLKWPAESGLAIWFVTMLLVVPISMSSVLLAPSPLLLIFPPLLFRLARHIKALAFVYALTTPLLVLVAGGLWLIVFEHNPAGILVVAVLFPPALLLHGRAWGRLAWLVLNFDRKPRKKKRRPKPEPDDDDAPVLNIALEPLDENDASYGVGDSAQPETEELATMTKHFEQQHEYERRIRERGGDRNPDPYSVPEPPTFQTALGRHVVSFPFDSESLGVWFGFGLYSLLEMTLVYVLAMILV